MRLIVRLLDIPKLDDLIEDNEFMRKVLHPDPYGGWHIVADAIQMKEVERLLIKNGIKYRLTPV